MRVMKICNALYKVPQYTPTPKNTSKADISDAKGQFPIFSQAENKIKIY